MVNNVLNPPNQRVANADIRPENKTTVKTAGICKRFFNSPIIIYTFNSCIIAGLIVTAVLFPTGIPAIVAGIAAGVLGLLQIASMLKNRKLLNLEVSVCLELLINNNTKPGKTTWYNKIDEHLYLGAIPLKNKNHHEILSKELKIDAVLTMLEKFENRSLALGADPVTPEDWETLNVIHQQIPAIDYRPLTLEFMNAGADFIHQQLSQGKTTYVHCKAGKSRSAAAIAAYYIKYKNERNLDTLIAKLKKSRPQINLTGQYKIALQKFINSL